MPAEATGLVASPTVYCWPRTFSRRNGIRKKISWVVTRGGRLQSSNTAALASVRGDERRRLPPLSRGRAFPNAMSASTSRRAALASMLVSQRDAAAEAVAEAEAGLQRPRGRGCGPPYDAPAPLSSQQRRSLPQPPPSTPDIAAAATRAVEGPDVPPPRRVGGRGARHPHDCPQASVRPTGLQDRGPPDGLGVRRRDAISAGPHDAVGPGSSRLAAARCRPLLLPHDGRGKGGALPGVKCGNVGASLHGARQSLGTRLRPPSNGTVGGGVFQSARIRRVERGTRRPGRRLRHPRDRVS